MRILFTNNTLSNRAGSELYVRDLATTFRRRGHELVAYSPFLGDVADDLRSATIPVTNDLRSIRVRPDVIHGQHHMETMAALAHFPGVPAVYVCHGWLPWQESAPRHPRIVEYVAVDATVRDRLIYEDGVDPADVRLLLNFVDLHRFRRRKPLPEKPLRALIFCNTATEDNFGWMVRAACAKRQIYVDIVGYAVERPQRNPEALLPEYDLVFARARSALEAMAVGCAVIVADPRGIGGSVTTSNFDEMRGKNFGIRTLTTPLTTEGLERAIEAYDADESARVSERVRNEADLETVASEYEEIYSAACRRLHAHPVDGEADREAFAAYLGWLSAQTKRPEMAEWNDLRACLDTALLDVKALRERLRLSNASDQIPPNRRGSTDAGLGVEVERLRALVASYESSPFIRVRDRLYGVPPLVWLYRRLRRRASS
ncbi:MAG: glycosyltransferase [Acidobacteriota bacterium]|nr:glycosyltransferase [Acidobacteriota bacterium]